MWIPYDAESPDKTASLFNLFAERKTFTHLEAPLIFCLSCQLDYFFNLSNCEASQTVKMSADNLDSLLKEPMDIAKVRQASNSRLPISFPIDLRW
jgi:hypothetical protein